MKYAFVTGASRGLGGGFVDYLLDQGYFVSTGVREIKKDYKNKENLTSPQTRGPSVLLVA